MRILVLRLTEGFLQRALSLHTTAEALAIRCIRSLRIDPSFERIEPRYVNSSTISTSLSPTIRRGGGRGELRGSTNITCVFCQLIYSPIFKASSARNSRTFVSFDGESKTRATSSA